MPQGCARMRMHAWRIDGVHLAFGLMILPTGVLQVVAGLVFHEKKLLITQRPADRHLGGLWEFPGGKVELGEDLRGALRRELCEELAIEVEVLDLLAEVTHAYPEKAVRLSFFQCRWIGGELRMIDCAAVAWVNPNELGSYVFPAADQELVLSLGQHPEWWDSGK
jgi:mutator protein MutT